MLLRETKPKCSFSGHAFDMGLDGPKNDALERGGVGPLVVHLPKAGTPDVGEGVPVRLTAVEHQGPNLQLGEDGLLEGQGRVLFGVPFFDVLEKIKSAPLVG